jgi:hypothetical protein
MKGQKTVSLDFEDLVWIKANIADFSAFVADKEPYLKDWVIIPTGLPNEAGQPTYYVVDPKWEPKKAGEST